MTKHTTRDQIWHAVLTLTDEKPPSGHRAKFHKNEVRDRLDVDPSDRTLRDTLNTMVDLGHLREARWGQGEYKPPEED